MRRPLRNSSSTIRSPWAFDSASSITDPLPATIAGSISDFTSDPSQLTDYVRRSGATNEQTAVLLQRFRDAQAKTESATPRADRAKKDVNRNPNDDSARNRLEKAQIPSGTLN